MKKKVCIAFAAVLMLLGLSACGAKEDVSIGVSFGVGPAVRWEQEEVFMQQQAAKLGVKIETRLNRTDEPKTQTQDCMEMIDSGIDVLVLIPRDATKVDEILAYAEEKKVPVVDYARVIMDDRIKLFVGYDSGRMGQKMGQFLAETVREGDYIFLRGDENDSNAVLLYEGAMRYLEPIKDKINILVDKSVPNWSPDEAKKIVREAIEKNNNKIDAILAPNDKIAGACAEVLKELGIEEPVVITGMDAELEAAQRLVTDEQAMTIYMDLQVLSITAINEAVNIARGDKMNTNSKFDIGNGKSVDANLITGNVVTKENLDKVLIESKYFTKEQVYGN